jgi:hypothetical protein
VFRGFCSNASNSSCDRGYICASAGEAIRIHLPVNTGNMALTFFGFDVRRQLVFQAVASVWLFLFLRTHVIILKMADQTFSGRISHSAQSPYVKVRMLGGNNTSPRPTAICKKFVETQRIAAQCHLAFVPVTLASWMIGTTANHQQHGATRLRLQSTIFLKKIALWHVREFLMKQRLWQPPFSRENSRSTPDILTAGILILHDKVRPNCSWKCKR